VFTSRCFDTDLRDHYLGTDLRNMGEVPMEGSHSAWLPFQFPLVLIYLFCMTLQSSYLILVGENTFFVIEQVNYPVYVETCNTKYKFRLLNRKTRSVKH
jgi:hypothetical protein